MTPSLISFCQGLIFCILFLFLSTPATSIHLFKFLCFIWLSFCWAHSIPSTICLANWWLTSSVNWSIHPLTKWYWFLLTYSSYSLSFSFRFSMLILRLWSSLSILNMSVTSLLTSLIDISSQIIAAPYTTLCNSLDYDTSIYVRIW